MRRIKLHLKDRSYDIVIGDDVIKDCGGMLKRLRIGRDAVAITNESILRIHRRPLEGALKKSGLTVHFETVPDSEKAKSSEVALGLVDRISAYDKNKTLFIIAFGGGVVGDLAGLVAAIYKRGVPYVQIPTTLLAQVDSAIGGKVAIDLPCAKNLVGAFYQPRMVLSDTSFIRTLSSRQIRNGLAEIIKYGVIKDKGLFEYLEKNYKSVLRHDKKTLEFVVTRSSAIKARIVEKDEFDKKGIRTVLNYGHTIGHAIETASGYSGRYDHGEAIAIGMVSAARIALKLGLMKETEVYRIERLIEDAGLPTKVAGLDLPKIYDAHLYDKKFVRGKNRFVLPTKIGSVKIVEAVPDSVIRDAIKERVQK